MKHSLISFSSWLALALFAAPLAAWADANPDFDDDAKPILNMQPGLLQYVESRFDVKDRGTAKFPGDDDRPPQPPFIFRARPLGSSGPYSLRLLIQPGPPGHILGVVDITKVHLTAPSNSAPQPQAPVARQPTTPSQPPATVSQAPAPSAPAASPQPSTPTAETPSGPILGSGTQPSSNPPSLEPPPDPAPTTH